jgi:hypothetical protein
MKEKEPNGLIDFLNSFDKSESFPPDKLKITIIKKRFRILNCSM